MKVKVKIPALLSHCCGGNHEVIVEATTLSQCFERLLEAYPLFKPHLFDEAGEQREHVLFFLNGENTRWLNSLDEALSDGDTVTILQAVTGG